MSLTQMTYRSNQYILALDPGNTYTGYCLVDSDCHPIKFGKEKNEDVMAACIQILAAQTFHPVHIAIERVASYGMPVGKEVFETCEWIGRFTQELGSYADVDYIYRKDEKMCICHSMKANDATIRQALVDRFAYGQSNHGKGTKNNPGFFYGFKADIWSAFAVAVTYHDLKEDLDGQFKGVGI